MSSFDIETKKKVYKLFPTQTPITAMVTGIKIQPGIETAWGIKTRVMIKLTTSLHDDDGDQMSALVSASKSLAEKASLRRFLKQWLGEDVGETYNITQILGTTRDVIFETNLSKDGRKFSNVSGVLKARGTVTLDAGFTAFSDENLTDGAEIANFNPNKGVATAQAKKATVTVKTVVEDGQTKPVTII